MGRLLPTLVASGVLMAVSAAPAAANHSWGSYHWAQASSTAPNVRVNLGDNLTRTSASNWPGIFDETAETETDADVVFNWTDLTAFPLGTGNLFTDILSTPSVTGANLTSQKRCRAQSGRVEVCNARYGYNGWLGLAQVWTSGGHIVQGTAKVNDTYFDSSRYNAAARQHVLCQEVGHTFGLGHTSEDGSDQHTCMDYDNALDNKHTNKHDNEQINAIYKSHTDPAGSAPTSTATQGKGKVRRVSKDKYVETFPNGDKITTFVTFTSDAAAARAPKDRLPE